MRDLRGSEIEPMSPALAGGFFTTEPPGKPLSCPPYNFFWPRHMACGIFVHQPGIETSSPAFEAQS